MFRALFALLVAACAPKAPPQPAAAVMPTILNLDHMEKETILKALRKHGFNISRAANELGLTRASLYRRAARAAGA